MKAIVYTAPKEFSCTQVPDPEIASDEALIRVRACGLCGTELHIHEGEFLAKFPLIPGHEIAGEIAHEFGLADYGQALEAVRSRRVIKATIIP